MGQFSVTINNFVGLKPQKSAPQKLNGSRATFESERGLRSYFQVTKYSFECTAQGWPWAFTQRNKRTLHLCSMT